MVVGADVESKVSGGDPELRSVIVAEPLVVVSVRDQTRSPTQDVVAACTGITLEGCEAAAYWLCDGMLKLIVGGVHTL